MMILKKVDFVRVFSRNKALTQTNNRRSFQKGETHSLPRAQPSSSRHAEGARAGS